MPFSLCLPLLRSLFRPAVLAIGLLLFCARPSAAQRYVVQEATLDGGGGAVTSGDLVLVSSLATNPVGTIRTDRYVLYSAWPSPFAGRAAILILHDPTVVGAAAEGEGQAVTARIVTNNAPLHTAILFYQPGGSPEPVALAMTPDDPGFVATIPGEDVGAAGLTYYFVVEDENDARLRAPRRGVYALPAEERVTVEVYNILGQRVATLKDGEPMPAGFHTVVWDAPRLASGMYFVQMRAGTYRKAQKLVRIQ